MTTASLLRLSHGKLHRVSVQQYRNFYRTQKAPMRVVPVPVRSDNYAYLLIDESTGQAAAIDPFDVPKVRAQAEKEGVKLTALITTHYHDDHSGGNKEFHSVYPDVPVYGGSDRIPALTNLVKDGDTFSVGENLKISLWCLTSCNYPDVWPLPATPETQFVITLRIQLGLKKEAFLLDTLFIAGCGRFFEGTAAEMNKALSYLGSLPGETVVYNGHEYTKASLAFGAHVDPNNPAMDRLRKLVEQDVTTGRSTIADEKEWNVFMRLGSKAVRSATKVDDEVEAMAKLRELKNSF
ncbi:Cytoplasmic glyoxalase II [Ceratobasidium sp. 370]|nr:Cytoplasmic glyoxalase II [Ceratobasidium sp. 370]